MLNISQIQYMLIHLNDNVLYQWLLLVLMNQNINFLYLPHSLWL